MNMNFLNQLLRGIAFVPALVNGIEALFGGKSGVQKKDAVMSFLENALNNHGCRGSARNRGAGKLQEWGVKDNRRNPGMPECFHVGQREQAGSFCDSPIAPVLDDR
jgi:hypothetical protein